MHSNYLKKKQILKVGIEEAWDFFSNPLNLATITPEDMSFVVTSEPTDHIYQGQIITYKVSPILKIPINWMTEITHVQAPYKFVDNQLIGPYNLWHHQHHFKEVPEGTLMTDLVHYSISPLKLGRIADKLFVRAQLNKIFDYRYQKIEEIFNQPKASIPLKRTV